MYIGYEMYKSSGEDWLGAIPYEWKIHRVKDIFDLITETSPVGNNETLLSIFANLGVKPREDMAQRGNKSTTTDNYWVVKKGDFIVNKLLAWMGAIGLSNYNGVTSPAYDIIRKKVQLNNKYFEYLFRTELYQSEFKKNSKGIMEVRLRLYFNKFGTINVPFPSYSEQNKIVIFLNSRIASVDTGVKLLEEKKQSLIDLRYSIISKCVLRGIKNDVKLIENDFKELGAIPVKWDIRRFKEVSILSTGNSIADKEMFEIEGDTYSYIATKDITLKNYEINYHNGVHIPRGNKGFKIAKKDSTLLCIEGGSAGRKVAYLDRDVCFVNKLCSIKSHNNKIKDRYLFYFIQSSFFKYQFNSVMTGLIGGVSISLLKNFLILRPSINDQIDISIYLDEKTNKIDEIIKSIDKNIDLLREYRKVLINDVVTGKIKVT